MQQGQVQHAQRQLEMFLMEGEGTQASQLLYQIYLEQNDFNAAVELLAQADTHGWSTLDQARLQAQGLLARQDPAAAVAVLESYLTEAQHDERYRVLLASLYRTTGRYHEAAASYRRLLESFGEAGSYWLGLALSLDALGEKHSALEAFQRAKNFQPLQAEVNLYIEQRIAALKR
jgi:MSHA biogenesis protein MshN